ncbi:hypothetical protein F4553_005835 [Allocatelliglobosispora scoriae]|uniref:EcsC family protein n=1 Tax=Allocatelliglobosispora scoriae TaxID=643052 RepID=A0A841C0J2_9ACTN|nr:hypothetical protein [Allocatelliglobosispora scoriae]MBB5872401.1 hypothetical protein [Allocatelliglobosispora scoriae]
MSQKKDQVPDDDSSGTATPSVGATGQPEEPALAVPPDELSAAVVALAEGELDRAGRTKVLSRLVSSMRGRGVSALFMPKKAVKWVADAVTDLAPHVPIRTLETLQRHYPGLSQDQLAERLIRNAARATGGVGAVGGGVASVEWVVPPSLLSTPVLLATETVAVVGIELKLIGELHEVYGQPIAGTGGQRAVSLLHAWAGKRGVNPFLPGVGVASVLGTAARKELRDMILKRLGRNLTTLGPLLTGAAVASYLNRRSTKSLGEAIKRDLSLRRPAALPPGTIGGELLPPGGGQ